MGSRVDGAPGGPPRAAGWVGNQPKAWRPSPVPSDPEAHVPKISAPIKQRAPHSCLNLLIQVHLTSGIKQNFKVSI